MKNRISKVSLLSECSNTMVSLVIVCIVSALKMAYFSLKRGVGLGICINSPFRPKLVCSSKEIDFCSFTIECGV